MRGSTTRRLRACEQGIALAPQYAHGWSLKATALGDAGRYDEALAAAQQAATLDPADAGAWNVQGIVLYHLGRYEEALVALDEALQRDPQTVPTQQALRATLQAFDR